MSNIRDFGAVGDGVVDDTAAIQHAIDDGNGFLELPSGDYRIERPLVFQLSKCGRTGINGSGGTARILMAGSGPAIKLLGTHAATADPAGFRPEEWLQERMPTVRDLEIVGAHPDANGIEIEGVMQPTITGVLIREVETAIRISNRARNVIISHCHLYHNRGVGVHLDNVNLHQVIIASNHISYCGLGGIRIENSEVRNLQITGNDIEYNNHRSHSQQDADELTGEILIDVQEGSVREGTICSNTIQATYSPRGANIRFLGQNDEWNQKVGMWTITGNLIGSQAYNIHLHKTRGITISGNHMYSAHVRNILVEGCRNIVMSGNCFGHNPDYKDKEICTGLEVRNSEDVVMSGMLIEDAASGQNTVRNAIPVKRTALMSLQNCQRMTISAVQLINPSPVGMELHECSDTQISNCTILRKENQNSLTHSVVWKGEGTGNMLSNCRVGSPVKIDDTADVTKSNIRV